MENSGAAWFYQCSAYLVTKTYRSFPYSLSYCRWRPLVWQKTLDSSNKTYLFRVQSLSKEFKKRYLGLFEKAYLNKELSLPGKLANYRNKPAFSSFVRFLFGVKWLIYAKRPFAGPEQVLEYLGRYTHRVAISNNRIKSIDNDQVCFEYRDRTDNGACQASCRLFCLLS